MQNLEGKSSVGVEGTKIKRIRTRQEKLKTHKIHVSKIQVNIDHLGDCRIHAIMKHLHNSIWGH